MTITGKWHGCHFKNYLPLSKLLAQNKLNYLIKTERSKNLIHQFGGAAFMFFIFPNFFVFPFLYFPTESIRKGLLTIVMVGAETQFSCCHSVPKHQNLTTRIGLFRPKELGCSLLKLSCFPCCISLSRNIPEWTFIFTLKYFF